jgi:ethanolamine utilization protein EutA
VDAENRIVRLDPAARRIAAHADFRGRVGDVAAPEELDRLAEWMADALLLALRGEAPATVRELWLTEPIGDLTGVEAIMFSGGVGEFVYGREHRDFGDLGRRLGEAVRGKLDRLRWPLLPAGECIRATALGASEYSVQLSGNTIYISDLRVLLPRRNLQVLQPDFDCPDEIDAEKLAAAIRAHFAAFDLVEGETEVALALRWRGTPSYARLKRFAAGIAEGLPNTIVAGKPLYVVLDGDVAQMLGNLLREEFVVKSELLVIDGIVLWDFDYIDIGRLRLPSNTVPVTVKSLVFSDDPRPAPGASARRRFP